MPVVSLILDGRFQPRTNLLPELLTCSTGRRGRPASFNASKPAAKESVVEISIAATIFGSIPYCSDKSKYPPTPASCGIVSYESHGTNSALPSWCLTIRTIFLSSKRCFISSDNSLMKFSPSNILSKESGLKTSSMPGRPRLIPVTT